MNQQDEIRKRILAKIEEKELTVRGVSLAAGLGETTLRNFLKGMTASVTVATLDKLAPELHATTKWLLTGEDEPMEAEVISILSRMPADRRDRALQILRLFEGGRE